MTVFTMRVGEDSVLGAGRDVSTSGAYFVTSDSVRVDVCYELDGCETQVPAKLVRMETISPGTFGVAVEFERPLPEEKLPD